MKRINYTLVLIGLALTTLLFFSSMTKIGDIKDKFDESEQVENSVISDDSFAHTSETEKTMPAVKSTTETGEKAVESSDPKKVFTGKVYDLVEQMPSFPGGLEELYKWIDNNVQYPAVAWENGIEGRVIVKFIVEKDGYGAYSYGIADTDNDVLYIPRDAMEGKIENFNLEQDAWNYAAFRELIERVMPERMEYQES